MHQCDKRKRVRGDDGLEERRKTEILYRASFTSMPITKLVPDIHSQFCGRFSQEKRLFCTIQGTIFRQSVDHQKVLQFLVKFRHISRRKIVGSIVNMRIIIEVLNVSFTNESEHIKSISLNFMLNIYYMWNKSSL